MKALIFDMDGLMLDTETMYRRVWQRASAEFGYSLTDEFYSNFVGRPIEVCLQMLQDEFGPQFPLAEFRVRSRELLNEEVETKGIPHKAGLAELLKCLESSPVPKGIATSTHRVDALHHLGDLAKHFDAITTVDEVVHGKPAPDIFLVAAQKLGVEPSDCWVLEDSETGARGALAAGMTVIIVPDLIQPCEEVANQAHRVCKSLHDVLPLLGFETAPSSEPVPA